MIRSVSIGFTIRWKQFARQSALATILVLTTLVFGWGASARADDHDDGVVHIMTQNLFQGTNFSEILSATTPTAFLMAVTTTRQNILATKPAERAAAVAREIARERPDLVALQEAAILRSGFVPLTVPATPVPTVEVDQLALVLAELEQLGNRYHVVAILPNLDAQAPSSTGASVRLTARMAIIARSDLGSDDIRLSNIQEQEYLNFTSVTTPVGVSISDPRGWASVDVKVNGREFRFITTHLDQNQSINKAQAAEALQSAVNSTTLPVVFVGDFNVVANIPSDPRFANYQALLKAGLVDAWQQSHGPDPGLNCCQPPALTNVTTNFTFRVDLVLLRGAIDIRNIHLVGNNISDRVDGVWPSDHAGIVATLRIPKAHN
jgi:endonuclease/exonuclease/phosphatase family metal-dependent hydrolase